LAQLLDLIPCGRKKVGRLAQLLDLIPSGRKALGRLAQLPDLIPRGTGAVRSPGSDTSREVAVTEADAPLARLVARWS